MPTSRRAPSSSRGPSTSSAGSPPERCSCASSTSSRSPRRRPRIARSRAAVPPASSSWFPERGRPMPRAHCNGIELEYETFGRRSARPLMLIMGLGAQMILWDEEFCAALAARDFFVVRFDNRDVGLSSKLDGAGVPNVFTAMQAAATGQTVDAPYTLNDMADDTVYLMAALGIDRAHVVGASMGGMIAQTLAIR